MKKTINFFGLTALLVTFAFAFSSYTKTETSINGVPQDIDVENLGMPSYRWDGDWVKDGLLPPNDRPTGETGENQVRRIKFDGARDGKIYRVIGSNGYWSSCSIRYKTLDDAIIAEYALQKYGKKRQKGRY